MYSPCSLSRDPIQIAIIDYLTTFNTFLTSLLSLVIAIVWLVRRLQKLQKLVDASMDDLEALKTLTSDKVPVLSRAQSSPGMSPSNPL